MTDQPPAAGLRRRLASLCYEVLIVAAIAFFAAFPFAGAISTTLAGVGRHLFQLYLFLVIGLYFVACWVRGGQTLPMKTWRLRLVSRDGSVLTVRRACLRYALAALSWGTAGAALFWALFDNDRQFLHDRIAGTRIIVVPPTTS